MLLALLATAGEGHKKDKQDFKKSFCINQLS